MLQVNKLYVEVESLIHSKYVPLFSFSEGKGTNIISIFVPT